MIIKKKYIFIAFVVFVILVGYTMPKKDLSAPLHKTEGMLSFTSTLYGFTIYYPKEYSIDEKYAYTVSPALGPSVDVHGVSFTIPQALTTGTNLSADTKISVEAAPEGSVCEAKTFLGDRVRSQKVLTENGVTYSIATAEGVAAGNIYEETVSVPLDMPTCFGIRLFLHSGNIGNFEPGTVHEFDKAALVTTYEKMRASLTITKK